MVSAQEGQDWEIRELCQSGAVGRAVELTLRRHGLETMRLIASVLHHPDMINDAFSLFCENLLKGLPNFRWESALRTWTYRLARNACYHLLKASSRRETPFNSVSIPDEAQRDRSHTPPWQQTSVKERFRRLRENLPPEERMLLLLRVDQQMPWSEVARVMWDEEEPPSSEELSRRATTLRQHFQRIKARLRELALQEGLIHEEPLDPLR
jgi:RNA polymerase sigma-70 factor (ECF subfamily)